MASADDDAARRCEDRTPQEAPRVPLNTALHLRIAKDGTARASTLESALEALRRMRSARTQNPKNAAP